jgi:hypothetical protein
MRYRILLGVLLALAVPAIGAASASSAPAGEGFSKKTAVAATLGSNTFDSTNASGTLRRGCGSSDGNGHVVWFTWTATESATITADTLGSAYDTVLYVFQGGKLLGCNDDTDLGTECPTGAVNPVCSEVVFDAVEGKTYYFAVAAFDGDAGGDTHLNLSD